MTDITTKGWRAVGATRRPGPKTSKPPGIPHFEQRGASKIDGNLDDAAWAKAAKLDEFMNYAVSRRKSLNGKTDRVVTFVDQCLYIAFECKDPAMKLLSIRKFEENQIFWVGDCVELAIAASADKKAYYHIRVNPENKRLGLAYGSGGGCLWKKTRRGPAVMRKGHQKSLAQARTVGLQPPGRH